MVKGAGEDRRGVLVPYAFAVGLYSDKAVRLRHHPGAAGGNVVPATGQVRRGWGVGGQEGLLYALHATAPTPSVQIQEDVHGHLWATAGSTPSNCRIDTDSLFITLGILAVPCSTVQTTPFRTPPLRNAPLQTTPVNPWHLLLPLLFR